MNPINKAAVNQTTRVLMILTPYFQSLCDLIALIWTHRQAGQHIRLGNCRPEKKPDHEPIVARKQKSEKTVSCT
jgi:hypothetical protein